MAAPPPVLAPQAAAAGRQQGVRQVDRTRRVLVGVLPPMPRLNNLGLDVPDKHSDFTRIWNLMRQYEHVQFHAYVRRPHNVAIGTDTQYVKFHTTFTPDGGAPMRTGPWDPTVGDIVDVLDAIYSDGCVGIYVQFASPHAGLDTARLERSIHQLVDTEQTSWFSNGCAVRYTGWCAWYPTPLAW